MGAEQLLRLPLQDAVGDRLTVRLRTGQEWRVALPFRPAQPLPAVALDALAATLEPALWHALSCRLLASPGLHLRFTPNPECLFLPT